MVGLSEVAFEEVPFEFSKFPAMVFLVAVGGLGYFRNKKKGGCGSFNIVANSGETVHHGKGTGETHY